MIFYTFLFHSLQVNIGSIADQAGLIAGDSVIKVNNVDVYALRHKDAQDIIVRSGNSFEITVQRGGSTWRPSVTPTGAIPSPTPYGNQLNTVTKTSLAHKQQDSQHIGCGTFLSLIVYKYYRNKGSLLSEFHIHKNSRSIYNL